MTEPRSRLDYLTDAERKNYDDKTWIAGAFMSGTESRFRRSSWGLDEVYYEDLEQALSRCSKRDRDLVLGWYNNMKRRQRQRESDAVTSHQTYRDLYRVVRDQQAHITSLEAQLLPHLRDTSTVQETLA